MTTLCGNQVSYSPSLWLGSEVTDSNNQIIVRAPLDLRAISLVLLLCVIWGVQQAAMKGIALHAPPVMQLAIRFWCAAVFFGLWVAFSEGRRAFADGTLRSGALLGLAFSIEFIFAGEALLHTSAAHSIVFLYTAPIFSALGLQIVPEERLSRLQWVGVAIAFCGIVVAFFGFSGRPMLELLLGDALALCGGISWGLSNVVLRRGRVGNAATAKTVFYQVATAAIVLSVFAAVTQQARFEPTTATIVSLVFQTLIISISSYLVWFWLLRHYLTSRLMLLSLLTPLCGVLSGTVLLGEPIELRFAVGATFVLAGVLIVNLHFLLQPAVKLPVAAAPHESLARTASGD